MLKQIHLANFKSFADERVDLAPLTLLVGANASGKSNLLDAIRFLQGIAIGMTLDEVLSERRSGGVLTWPGIRGGAQEIALTRRAPFAIETAWRVPDPVQSTVNGHAEPRGTAELSHRIECTANGRATLHAERLTSAALPGTLFEASQAEQGRISTSVMPNEPDILVTSTLPVDASLLRRFTAYGDPETDALRRRMHPAVRDGAVWLSHEMSGMTFLELNPAAMRRPGSRSRPLGIEGENISGRLAEYCEDHAARQGLVDWLRELCAPSIRDIDFIETPELDEVTIVLVENDGRRISARSLSEGTLRFLGIFAALRAIDPGPIVLLEEIDTGLHPKGIHLLVQFLEQVVRARDIQVIATTHSPVVLQWLSEPALRDVVVFGRVPEQPGTVMRRLGALERFDEIIKLENIDVLFTSGWMETAL
jgi:predicted ATPase